MIDYKGKTKPQSISPSQAQSILQNEMYEYQRKPRMTDARKYALMMHRGEWMPGSMLTYCLWQKKRYWINGGHRLLAVTLFGKPVVFEVQEIPVESYEEIAQWYRIHDRLRLRNLADLYVPFHLPEKHAMNQTQTNHIMACLGIMAAGFEPLTRVDNPVRIYTESPLIRMAFLDNWREEGMRYVEDTRGARKKITMNLRRTGVMAAALVTYRSTGNDAEEFWHKVAMDDGLRNEDPCKLLHIFLGSTLSGEYPAHALTRYVATAWNAAWQERPLHTLPPQQDRLPLRLEGTPHDGKAVYRYISPKGDILQEPVAFDASSWQQELFTENGDRESHTQED